MNYKTLHDIYNVFHSICVLYMFLIDSRFIHPTAIGLSSNRAFFYHSHQRRPASALIECINSEIQHSTFENMKLALRLPHSLDMTLSAIAHSLSSQTVILNTFTVLCYMEENTTNLQLKYFSDVEAIFTIEIVKIH